MAFNRGIDADLTKVYNGQYGLPFSHGETYTNPNNQTFTFVNVDTTNAVSLIPGTGVGLNIGGNAGNVAAHEDGGGRVAGAYFGDGKTACISDAGAIKKGVWVQSGGRPAGDIWCLITNVNGADAVASPNTGIGGMLGFSSLSAASTLIGVDEIAVGALGQYIHSNLSVATGGEAAEYSTNSANGVLNNGTTAVIRGFSKTASPILILQKVFTSTASRALVESYTVGKYLNIGDHTKSTPFNVNAITVQIIKQITDSVSGNVIGATGRVVGASDATGADLTTLFYGTVTNTTAGSGNYAKITGTGTGGATAALVSGQRNENYIDQTAGTAGLNFFLGIDSALADITC